MHRQIWFKKDVTLDWQGKRVSLGVAQELFSSHDVDAGSRLLLRSLDPSAFPDAGQVVDFGCGYGVLGIAWLTAKPGWRGTLIDRDALAVAFAADNAVRLGLTDVDCRVGLDVDGLATSGAGPDLLLWNVPGKAGESVLQALTLDCLTVLERGGVLALVVVNPLADLLREAIAAHPAAEVTYDQRHADHTVIHVRSGSPAQPVIDPLARSLFDREEAGFGVDEFEYDIVPVVGLPEYDSYDYATEVAFDIFRTVVGQPEQVLAFRPGQGHLPLVAAHQFTPTQVILADRNLLSVRASARAMRAVLNPAPSLVEAPIVDLADLGPQQVDLAVLHLEDQVRNEVHIARLADLESLLAANGQVVVCGGSTVVSRFLSFAAKRKRWKLRDRTKRSGASAARLELVSA